MIEDINETIKNVKKHISTIEIDTEKMIIENIIVAGLLMLVVSEYEKEIKEIFIRRAVKSKDRQLINFTKSMMDEKISSSHVKRRD